MSTSLEVIDAFVDGERVDAVALKRALADEDARDYMIDAWLLREHVQDEIARDLPMPGVAASPRKWIGALLVAAAALVAVGGAYLTGYRMAAAARPAAAATAAVTASVAPPKIDSQQAPAPTRVIRLQPGVDWKENAGGG